MITFALRNVLCTKGGIPVYFQESEPGSGSCRSSAGARMRRCGRGECVIDFFSTPELDEMPDTAVSLHCLQERGINLTRCCSFPLLLCGQLCCTEDEGGGGEGGKREKISV